MQRGAFKGVFRGVIMCYVAVTEKGVCRWFGGNLAWFSEKLERGGDKGVEQGEDQESGSS